MDVVFEAIIGAGIAATVAAFFLTHSAAIAVVTAVIFAAAAVINPKLVPIREYERGVIFRFGKYRKTVGPGVAWILSRIDDLRTVETRDQLLDIPPQNVVTKENVKITVDAAAYYKIVDATKSALEVKDFKNSLAILLQSQIRAVIGNLSITEVVGKTEEISNSLYRTLDETASKWGVKILRVELQHITLPEELVQAFQKRREAEENKARVEIDAQAQEIRINTINRAARDLSDKTLAYYYVDALRNVYAGEGSKIILPVELNKVASMLSAALETASVFKSGGEKQRVFKRSLERSPSTS